MAIGVAGRPVLTRARTGTGALARVATVSGNLPFARHDQVAVKRLARYSAMRSRALLRRDSNEASIPIQQSEDDLLRAMGESW
jgi:hypothetical protein